MRFENDGQLVSDETLPPNLVGARIEGISKVSPRHAALAFVVTAMFTTTTETSEPTTLDTEKPPTE